MRTSAKAPAALRLCQHLALVTSPSARWLFASPGLLSLCFIRCRKSYLLMGLWRLQLPEVQATFVFHSLISMSAGFCLSIFLFP